jgi:hypothetical protein
MTDHPVNQSIAAALASLSGAFASLQREAQHTKGLVAALEARIADLEAKAATPTVIPTVTALAARGPELTTFERVSRPVRDGQW